MSKVLDGFGHVVRFLMQIITPNTYRWLFLRQTRVAFYLTNGSVIKFNCREWKVTLTESYSYTGSQTNQVFKPKEIIAAKQIMWF